MPYAESLRQLIGRGVDAAAAINAPGRRPLTYGGLRDLVDMTAGRLEAELERLVAECLTAAGRLQPPLTEAQRAQFERAARSAAQDLLTRLAIDG